MVLICFSGALLFEITFAIIILSTFLLGIITYYVFAILNGESMGNYNYY